MIACSGVFFIALFSGIILHAEVCEGTKDGSFRETLKGHRLENNQLKVVTALSVVECSLACLRKSCCRSVNYAEYVEQTMEQNCELNDAKASTNPEDVIRNDSYTHYELLDTGIDENCQVSTDECSLGSSQDHPGKSCNDIKQHVCGAISKEYWIKPTNTRAFLVYCEMTLDGGGWTLVYRYTFTNYEDFYKTSNAVTPRPNWNASNANVNISTKPPLKNKHGAVDYNLWKHIGSKEFFIKSNISDWYKCSPVEGSLLRQKDGSISCEHNERIVTTCNGTSSPTNIGWESSGPILKDGGIPMYRFDGSTLEFYPTHNPCSPTPTSGVKNHKTDVVNPGGEILIR